VRSRSHSAQKAGDHALLLVLEPDIERLDDLEHMLDSTSHCLVALPKWSGQPDPRHPGWVSSTVRLAASEVQQVLDVTSASGTVTALETATDWRSELGLTPTLATPQLVHTDAASPVTAAEGALLVRLDPDTASQWVLTDPDILSNHGLGRGDNAELALRILELVAPRDWPIVLDETLHGFEVKPDIWGELGRFPLVLVLGQAFATLLALVWAGAVRFGSPQPTAQGLAAGKAVLIDNMAELLLVGGHTTSVLRRYFVLAQRRIAAAYHFPPDLPPERRRQRLDRIAEARGALHRFEDLEAAVAESGDSRSDLEHRSLAVARDIRSWTMEMLDANR